MDTCSEIRKRECARLWKKVFGDSDEFISSFMENIYDEENMLCIIQEEKLVSMLHIIYFEFKGTKVAYLYAVATDVNSRGRGYAKRLINLAISKAKKNGCKAIFTLPADEGLHTFYSQFGFKGKLPVKFESKTHFDFGTGDIENDIVTVLPLEDRFAILPENVIVLTYTGM